MLTLASDYIKIENMNRKNEKRHKCHFCGAVRYESKMRKLKSWETNARSQFGNDMKCWACQKECRPDKIREKIKLNH